MFNDVVSVVFFTNGIDSGKNLDDAHGGVAVTLGSKCDPLTVRDECVEQRLITSSSLLLST